VIARWEQGVVSPSVETLLEIVRACGFDLPLELAIGDGLRPRVASTADLARMLAARGLDEETPLLLSLRRLTELERDLGRGLDR
jgi:hypothetical protein